MCRLISFVFYFVLLASTAFASGLTYPSGTVTFVNKNMIVMGGNTYKLLENTPVRILRTKDKQTDEVKAMKSDIRLGSYVTLHTAGNIVVDVLVERR